MKWQEAGEDYIMRNFRICKLHKIFLELEVKEDEMGGECSTHGRDEEFMQNLGRKT
jgi:hypothetical protein